MGIVLKMYVQRVLENQLLSLSKQYPVLSITGPRQSGKTTMVRKTFPEKSYYSLENPDNMDFAISDPIGFLSQAESGMIIDEVQRVPQLFSYLQGIVDDSRQTGRYILTGSQNFLLLEKITQSLAGRVAITKLLPFSQSEYKSKFDLSDLDDVLISGMYPPIYDRNLNPDNWFDLYITTYIERDVRSIKNIDNLYTFGQFLKLCAGRSGQILNYSSLADDCGINHNTAKAWISVLEASYIVSLLPPYYKNFNKRLIKAPKLYFLDTGLLCYLLRITSKEILFSHPLKGAVFETYVYSELIKLFFNKAKRPELYYWRDKTGHEIDFLFSKAEKLISLEVKAGKTISSDHFKNIKYWRNLTEQNRSFLIYGGEKEQKRSLAHVLPVKNALEKISEVVF